MAFKGYDVPLDNGMRVFNAQAISTATTTSSTTIDVGAANVFARYMVVIDFSGLTITGTEDETYRFQVQVGSASNFATQAIVAQRILGDKEATFYTHDTPSSGRVVLYCDNVATFSSTDPGSVAPAQYIRLQCVTGGTTPAITVTAWFVPL